MLIDKQEKQIRDGVQQVKQQVQRLNPPPPSSSPSHEFSFTVSLHPPPPTTATATLDKNKSPPPTPFAIDLTPADEIFFHGHLLPLHLLSHLPAAAAASPRSSTNSLDSFTLPIKELSQQNTTRSCDHDDDDDDDQYIKYTSFQESTLLEKEKARSRKSKSFSLFGLPRRRRKGCDESRDQNQKRNKSKKFDVSHVLQRYMRLIKPFLFSFRNNRRGNTNNRQVLRQPFSFSGNLQVRGGRRGEFSSAPVSMRTSPANSGVLVASSGCLTPTTASSDSTMEELQAAIQAAIAHCKKSIATEDRTNKLP